MKPRFGPFPRDWCRSGRRSRWGSAAAARAGSARRAARYDGAFVIGYPGPEGIDQVREAVAADRGGIEGYDVVVDVLPDTDPAPWSAAGATWVLTRFGPYDLDVEEARRIIAAGP